MKISKRNPIHCSPFGEDAKGKQVKRLVTLSIGYAYLGKVARLVDCQERLSKLLKTG